MEKKSGKLSKTLEWLKGDSWSFVSGIRDSVLFLILFGILILLLIPVIYWGWSMDEAVNLSFTCEELSYAIKNMEADTQIRFHYKDRCLT